MARTEGDDATLVASELRSLSPGSVFAGRYVIEGRLGEGGMGSVHAAVDRQLGDRVALKVLGGSGEVRPATLERFRREVRVARRVTHRNASRTFDIGEHAGLHFLTMELVDGESLAERLLRDGALALGELVEIGSQICEGLAAVHEAGIVHRDLKPANVLLATSGRVVLTDFGIARPVAEGERVTVDGGALVGTPHYMAPEQVAGEPVTPKVDLYALGLVLYEMATGRLPFEGGTAIAVAVARLHEEPSMPATLPGWLSATITACLRRRVDQRPPDAGAVARMLRAGAVGSETVTTAPASVTAGPTSPTPSPVPPSGGFASVNVGDQSLAVLPLRYRGPADDAYLAEALTEQLIDVLSMTRGLRVPAAGAVEPFSERRDPRAVREALGVDAVVDGTVQRSGSRLRVIVRLLDASTGYQTWTERFDGELEDVFDLQDTIAARVAETLRLELESRSFDTPVSEEAVALYMRARVLMRGFHSGGRGPGGAADLLRRCLELAPGFPPALASYAGVCGWMWFLYGADDGEFPWARLCEQLVAEALEKGPRLPDAHLAAARMHTQRGQYTEAARALQRALDLAPTYAQAHSYLGVLQCEAGHVKEGVRHIELAVELEPNRLAPLITVARHHALRGDREAFESSLRRMWDEGPADARFPLEIIRLRVANWTRDLDEVRKWRDALAVRNKDFPPFAQVLGSYVLGEVTEKDLEASLDANAPPTASPRYRTMLEQNFVEGLLAREQVEPAMERLARIADEILVDVDWLEHCPLLVELHDDPRMSTVRRKVRDRAQAIWTVG